MINEILATITASLLAAFLYRMGGISDEDAKKYHLPLWLAVRQTRIIGIPFVVLGMLYLLGLKLSWWWLLSFGLQAGFLSTYNKWFQRLFGYPTDDVYLPAWIMTGITYGLALLPLCLVTHKWAGAAIRTVILGILIPVLRENTDNVWAEECGSGFLYAITAPLVFI